MLAEAFAVSSFLYIVLVAFPVQVKLAWIATRMSDGQQCIYMPAWFTGSTVASKALTAMSLKGMELYYVHS